MEIVDKRSVELVITEQDLRPEVFERLLKEMNRVFETEFGTMDLRIFFTIREEDVRESG